MNKPDLPIYRGLPNSHHLAQADRDSRELIETVRVKRKPTTHELKIWPRYFRAIKAGRKPFELRKADRRFRIGDTLDLREWDPVTEKYTGRRLERRVSYILQGGVFGVEKGY